MPRPSLLKLMPLLALLAIQLSGCESTASKDGDALAPVTDVGGSGPGARHSGYGLDGGQGYDDGSRLSGPGGRELSGGGGGDPALNDPGSPLYKKVVYFEYDSFEILPEYRDLIRAHSQYLASHGRTRVTLEGHADERGSREYNIALGERRAEAVKRLMAAEGASSPQLRTISYGEERPVVTGSGEEAWALNRRVELVYGN